MLIIKIKANIYFYKIINSTKNHIITLKKHKTNKKISNYQHIKMPIKHQILISIQVHLLLMAI